MEYRQLGRSGVQVSALCLGCMNFGDRTSEEDSVRIIHAAIEKGLNFIDTANTYSDGLAEEIVGKALAEDGRRDRVVLATKVTGNMGRGPNESGSSRYTIRKHCEDSLRRLKTDHIDLYQLHWMDVNTPLYESLRMLDDLVRAGKVLYVGCSKFATRADHRGGADPGALRLGEVHQRTAAVQPAGPADRERVAVELPGAWAWASSLGRRSRPAF